MAQFEAILLRYRMAVVGKSNLMQHWIHEITGTVAGERSACAIRSVRAGCKPQDEYLCSRITEAWDRTCPIGVVEIGATLYHSEVAAVGAESLTPLAGDDKRANLV